MAAYRYGDQHTPPPAHQVTDVAIIRFEHVYEVEPSLMTAYVTQQTLPKWDMLRIVRSRHDHLDWMHKHWAHRVISGEELLKEMESESAETLTGEGISS
jgi:hypothetical protein